MNGILLTCVIVVVALAVEAKNVNFLRQHLDGRIVGGEATTIEQYPHQVSIETSTGWHFCGGSVISSTVILTAAHCAVDLTPNSVNVRAGTTKKEVGGVLASVKNIHVNEKYNSGNVDYDVALLVLSEPLPLSNKIKPVPLPAASEYLGSGKVAVTTGWGALEQSGSSPKVLQKVEVPIVDQKKCNDAYGGITDRMLCAGLDAGGKDACQGDSGGPLVSNGKIHGIVSWGYGCAQPGYPGVYTRVTAVRDWIKSKVNV